MDLKTGEIKHVPEGEKPTDSMVELSDYEERYLAGVPDDLRTFELFWLRSINRMIGTKKKRKAIPVVVRARMKEAFRHGWNSAVFAKPNEYVVTDLEMEAEKAQDKESQ